MIGGWLSSICYDWWLVLLSLLLLVAGSPLSAMIGGWFSSLCYDWWLVRLTGLVDEMFLVSELSSSSCLWISQPPTNIFGYLADGTLFNEIFQKQQIFYTIFCLAFTGESVLNIFTDLDKILGDIFYTKFHFRVHKSKPYKYSIS